MGTCDLVLDTIGVDHEVRSTLPLLMNGGAYVALSNKHLKVDPNFLLMNSISIGK